MRIHLLSNMLCQGGGADVYNEALALGLVDRGHTVAVISQKVSDHLAQRCQAAVIDLPAYDKWPALWRGAPYFAWQAWQRFIARLRLPPADVLICSKGSCSAALAKRFPQARLIYLPHSRIEPVEIDQMLPPSASWFLRKLACSISSSGERWSLVNAATTVRFTAGNVDDLRRHYQLPKLARFDVIPAGVIGPPTISPREFTTPLRLLCVCRLVESKNVQFLLESLAGMTHLPWHLDIVGDGPERTALEELAGARGLLQRVRFHGHQVDTTRFYHNADLHVFPSRLESLGLVVLEAMAYGVPTLAIAADGVKYRNANREIIAPDSDGLLATNEADFCHLLQSCITSPQRLSELGGAARRTYLERHQWPVVIDRWESLLRDIAPVGSERSVQRLSARDALSPALVRT